ncbi:related to protein-tyrosine phosphatase [Cephalotrichum gorgonifer]|uniref:Related to protein-tyrosine phosphatase n=1 Tax=Cephalotrichum gorgonifer TaxID=2041049 RepID=A0AAE8MX58_9PEZI|nr:related to protein-tyrosine phosphatase [Cephalotrichum gorgonifer]
MADTAYNLADLLTADVRNELPSHAVNSILSQPPFATVPGVPNIRDLGRAPVRAGFPYRAGVLTGISEEGKAALRTRGVTAIFDLRNPGERAKQPSPEIEGIKTVWEPYTRDPTPPNPADFATEDGSVLAYVEMYSHILELLTPIFKKVFEHIKLRPQESFLFHCNAGKDRTGVLAALILLLAEAPSEAIVHDYILSRVGTEPMREMIMKSGIVDLSIPAMRNLSGVRAETMTAFLEALEQRFGGVRGYLAKDLGFTEEDVATIAANLKAEV